MEFLKIPTRSLTEEFSYGDINLVPQLDNVLKFWGIPKTLQNVDAKFKTNVLLQVIRAATDVIDVAEEDGVIQVLDPKSQFMPDSEFDTAVDIMQEASGNTALILSNGFQKKAEITVTSDLEDSFLGDVFSKQLVLTRKAEGGVCLSTQIVRQVCTNGLQVLDKQFSNNFRNGQVDSIVISGMLSTVQSFSVDEYLKGIFTSNGVEVPCSVADMFDMKDCLSSLTDADTASLYYPVENVKEFYASQNIELDSLARKYLLGLPSGLTYWQSLNILTNGAKLMADKTIDNEIKIAKFATPHKMQALKSLHWEGQPEFSSEQIKYRMGDLVTV